MMQKLISAVLELAQSSHRKGWNDATMYWAEVYSDQLRLRYPNVSDMKHRDHVGGIHRANTKREIGRSW
jgi:hypothetical protein